MNENVKDAIELMASGNLSKALDSIKTAANDLGLHSVSSEADKLISNLEYMLNNFERGAQDPSRSDMLASVYDKAYDLVTQLRVNTEHIPCSSGNLTKKLGNLEIFDNIEKNYPATSSDRNFIQQLILDEGTPLYLKASAISALMFNLLEFFDNEKFESLYTYTLEDQPIELRIRAWVAIVFVSMAHDSRISTQPRLVEQMKFICEEASNDSNEILLKIQMYLFQCLEAKKVRDSLLKDFTSTIDNKISEIKEKKALNDNEKLSDHDRELLENEIEDKVQDMMDLFSKGVDILYDSFAQTSKSQFFTEKSSWFLLFTADNPVLYPIVADDAQLSPFIKILANSRRMSSTDKYTNFSVFQNLQKSQLMVMERIMEAQNKDNNQTEKEIIDEEIIHYLHDLYRYYTIFKPSRKEYNPFEHNLYFGRYNSLADGISDINNKKEIANLLVLNKQYDNALTPLKEIVATEKSKEYMLRYAYCLNKTNYESQTYCDILTRCYQMWPDDKWTIRHYADLLFDKASYLAAEDVLLNALKIYPDVIGILLLLSDCYIKQNRYADAMHYLYKANLLDEGNTLVISDMAWCSLILGEKEKAERYIASVLNEKANSKDWIRGGHIALLNNNTTLAFSRYYKADSRDLKPAFLLNSRELIKAGITQDVLTLARETLLRHRK